MLSYFAAPRPTAPQQVFPTLTDRERDILRLIAHGLPNPAIASQLNLSPKTVGNYVSNIFGKLQVADRATASSAEAGLAERRTGSRDI